MRSRLFGVSVLALLCVSCGGGGSGAQAPPVSGGTVTRITDTFQDNTGVPGEENVVGITHEDGSQALYFHLAENGAMVTMQQVVGQGDVIALSGNSGNSTEPHVHFVVAAPPGTGGAGSVPVTFSNTDPHPNGLVAGRTYLAR